MLHPLRLRATKTETPFTLIHITMAKKSGKRFTIRAPGRRRLKPGPKPKAASAFPNRAPRRRQLTKEQIESLKMIKEAKQFATEMLKMIKEAKQFAVEKMIKDRLKEETEKMMIKKAKQFADESNLMKALKGWQDLHYAHHIAMHFMILNLIKKAFQAWKRLRVGVL